MRAIIVLLLCTAVTASAGTGLYVAEISIGTAAGFGGLMLGMIPATSNWELSDEETGYVIAGIICAQTLTTAAGVWLTGEFIGDGSDNRGTVFWPTLGGSALGIVPLYGLAFATVAGNEGGEPGGAVLIASSLVAGPVVSTVFYNVFREPRAGTVETGYDVRPYTNLLADNGAGPVPVYGVSVSF